MTEPEFLNHLNQRLEFFNEEAKTFFQGFWSDGFYSGHIGVLKKSALYSFENGGKRFRPVLAFMVGEALGLSPRKVTPWAIAVEMIHTYSLIHDDLPSMDNDDFRRGLPSNHKVFGESTAILAGDFLLTEAFRLLSESKLEAALKVELIKVLATKSGGQGMLGGQALDLKLDKTSSSDKQNFGKIHDLKTAALISASVEGVAVISQVSPELIQLWSQFGQVLGKSFQIKDDILDKDMPSENSSIVLSEGIEKAQGKLELLENEGRQILSQLGIEENSISLFLKWNKLRTK